MGVAYGIKSLLTSARENNPHYYPHRSGSVLIPLSTTNHGQDIDREPLLPSTAVHSENRQEAESSTMTASRYANDPLEGSGEKDRDIVGVDGRDHAAEDKGVGSMFANAAVATGPSVLL